MKRMLVALALCFSPNLFGAPFLYSDPDPTGTADICGYSVNGGVDVETPVVDGGCKIDLAGFPEGNNNTEVWFKSSLWDVESARVPFAFNKPSAGSEGPTGNRIGK